MSEKCVITVIETLQDYLRYKETCKRRDKEIKEFKSQILDDEDSLLVAEPKIFEDNIISKRLNSIPIIDIIEYMEDMEPEMLDDLKAVQLMLYKLAGWRCSAEEYKRIGNADRKVMKKAKRAGRNVIVKDGGSYNENVKQMKNNYGRRKKY